MFLSVTKCFSSGQNNVNSDKNTLPSGGKSKELQTVSLTSEKELFICILLFIARFPD